MERWAGLSISAIAPTLSKLPGWRSSRCSGRTSSGCVGEGVDGRAYRSLLNLLAELERPPSGPSDAPVTMVNVIDLVLIVVSFCWAAAATLIVAVCRVAAADDACREPATTGTTPARCSRDCHSAS